MNPIFKMKLSYSTFHFTVCFRTVFSEEQRKKGPGQLGRGGGGQGHDDDDDSEEEDGDDESVNMSR